jgi:hypothetical protein
MGDLQPHMIPTVLIDAMKNTTLLSVSQMCGQKIPLCGIFPFHQMLPYLKLVSENCDEVLKGKVENSLYVMESNYLRRTERLLVTSVKDPSIYDHVHRVLGHHGD